MECSEAQSSDSKEINMRLLGDFSVVVSVSRDVGEEHCHS